MADAKPGRGSDQFPLRLPDGMRHKIKEAADANGRSMNAEIVSRLEFSLRMHPHAYLIRALLDLQEKLMGGSELSLSDETAAFLHETAQRFGMEPNALLNVLLRGALNEMDNNTAIGKKLAASLDAYFESQQWTEEEDKG